MIAWEDKLAKSAIAAIAIVMICALCLGLCSCGGSRYKTGTEKPTESASARNPPVANANYGNTSQPAKPKSYTDPRWPTTDPQLLAIPEEQRWYNAWNSVDTTCTIVGPVVDVYQAKDANGMPIFVSIGVDYPDQDSVTLVIWADNGAAFDEMLRAIDHGNAWIAVTSYLTTYDGYLQFSSDNYVEWTYWTGVS